MTLFAQNKWSVKRNPKVAPHYYQSDGFKAMEDGWKEFKRIMAVLPTGGGKTVLAGEMIARRVEKRKRVLVMAHTRKLAQQFRDSLEENYGLHVGMDMAEHASDGEPVVCATFQTMLNRVAKGKFHPEFFDLVVIDECHRILGPGYLSLMNHFKSDVLGLSATPRRADQKDLMTFFDSKVVDVPLNKLIKEKYLAPLTIINCPISIRISGESKTGDITEDEAAHAIEPYLESCAMALKEHGAGRCSLAFLPLIDISKRFTAILCGMGVRAAHVDGQMKEKEVKEIIRDLELGKLDVVCNSMLLTEGVDIRPVDCIMNLRPTKSWTLYCQIVGRGTRTFDPAKHGIKGTTRGLKTDCVARGSKILTDKGLVEIQDLTLSHKVWDGESFVSHSGAICKGVQKTITYEGITATPDHKVWTKEGWQTLKRVSERQIPISVTGDGGTPIREDDSRFTRVQKNKWMHQDVVEVPSLRKGKVDAQRGGYKGSSLLQRKLLQEKADTKMANSETEWGDAEMQESKQLKVSRLRRKRNKIQLCFNSRSRFMDSIQFRASQGNAIRQDKKRRSLRARKYPLVNTSAESCSYKKDANISEIARFSRKAPRNKIRRLNFKQTAFPSILRRGKEQVPQPAFIETEREVWDILNCGPLHRFTCNGLLVHNCLLLDPLWLCEDLNPLKRPACLLAKDDDDEREIMAKVAAGEKDLMTATESVARDRQESLLKRLEEMAKRKSRLVDACEFFLKQGDLAGAEYEPISRWQAEAITQGQRNILIGHGIDLSSIKDKGQATLVINQILARDKAGLAPARVAKEAESLGLQNAYNLPKEQVRNYITCKKAGDDLLPSLD